MSSFQWRVGEIIKEDAALAAAPSQDLPPRQVGQPELVEMLERHREWVESRGIFGKRLELARANFEGMDLTGANLQGAILNKANFQRAELLLADLRGASLVQADLRESNLLGADFKGANLEGASIDGAAGLHTKQLAGASLLWAVLPSSISEFEGQSLAELRARQCYRLFVATLLACALSCLRIATTRDVLLLRDAPLIPIPRLGAALPISGFYVVMPLVIFGLFLYLHVSMERLWERLIELPAIFPDGRPVDRSGSWLLMTLFRRRFHGWTGNQASPSVLESVIPLLLAYVVVPATLLMFWARYLIMQDLRAAMLQIAVFVLALVVTTALPKKDLLETLPSMYSTPIQDDAGLPPIDSMESNEDAQAPVNAEETVEDDLQSPLFAEMPPEIHEERAAAAMPSERTPSIEMLPKPATRYGTPIRRASSAAILGALLAILTLGIVYGAPHDSNVMPDYGVASLRRWSADAFWAIGYRPYADLTESAVAVAPAGWSGRDEDVAKVKGAQLNNLRLRYAQGYRTFWANSHLWKADLQGAYFSESDFRGANLREANLRSAAFDRVQLFRANLQGAQLEKANLTRADLRETDLSYALLHAAIIVDARLGGANLFNSDLREARLAHANFERADLREANLSSADLSLADLQDAYLWSTKLPAVNLRDAQLNRAILIEADLRGSDLRGANLGNAVVRGADFTGANLAGADLRGASGLTATQVCSASDRRETLLDDAIIPLVQTQCGTPLPQGSPN
jgi:uncharacterized protein YjbI with pentapeptide repeats